MNSDWVIKLLPELPSPPLDLLAQFDFMFRPEQSHFSPKNVEHLGVQTVQDWQHQKYEWIQPMASNKNKRQRFSPEINSWIQKNITLDFQWANSGIMFFDEPQLPHTDLTRDFVLLYNLQTGGPDTKLCFWQEIGKSVYRDRMVTAQRGQGLRLLETISGPANQWPRL